MKHFLGKEVFQFEERYHISMLEQLLGSNLLGQASMGIKNDMPNSILREKKNTLKNHQLKKYIGS